MDFCKSSTGKVLRLFSCKTIVEEMALHHLGLILPLPGLLQLHVGPGTPQGGVLGRFNSVEVAIPI